MLAATILQEELFGYDLVGVFGSEVNVFQILLAVQRRANTFSSQANFKVDSVVDDDVESVLEFLDFISIAYYIDNFVFVRLEDAVSLDDLPDAFFVFCKGSVLCIDL